MTDIVICYTGKSCVTGKALFEKLKMDARFRKVRKVLKNKRIRSTDVFLRWGNASSDNPEGCIEINNVDAIINASSKKRMIRLLNDAEGVTVPPFFFTRNVESIPDEEYNDFIAQYQDEEGNFFVRDNEGKVRYDNDFGFLDSYVMKPIDKVREYRVHVFDGEVIAIYEKIPNEGESGLVRKDINCKFSRCNPSNTRCNDGAQQMCIDAVNALGLTFGGVDIIRKRKVKGEEFEFFVTEVNSSPALNTNTIQTYVDRVVRFINKIRGVTDDSEHTESNDIESGGDT